MLSGGLHLRSPQNIHANAKLHQKSLRAWNLPLRLVRDIGILIYLVIMRTSSGRVLLKIKLSKCVQSSHSIPQSHPVIRFDTEAKDGSGSPDVVLTSVKVHLLLHLRSLQTQPLIAQSLVWFRVTLARTCPLSACSNAPAAPAPAVQGRCQQMICPEGGPGSENCQPALPCRRRDGCCDEEAL